MSFDNTYLKKKLIGKFHRRVHSPPPSIEIDDHEEYEVEKVLDSRRKWGELEYLVHWSGYDINE
jgi:hypothetical protein